MQIVFTVTDPRPLLPRGFCETMCSLIQEHTLYESYITADQSQFVVEVSDKDIYNNPDLLDNLASLTEQIARLGQIADLRVEFTPIPRQQ